MTKDEIQKLLKGVQADQMIVHTNPYGSQITQDALSRLAYFHVNNLYDLVIELQKPSSD